MIALYLLASLLTILVGFRDAAGRNTKINKRRYYVLSVLRALGFGQLVLCSLMLLAKILQLDQELLGQIAERSLPIYVAYAGVVLCTFVPYTIPSWEIKSVVTVLVFGPLTLLQPVVIIVGAGYSIYPYTDRYLEVIFVLLGTVFCLCFELLLDKLQWSQKAASLSYTEK